MRFISHIAVMVCISFYSNAQNYFCYSTDTIQSEDNLFRIIIDSATVSDVRKTTFKIEASTPLDFKEIRFTLGTPDILFKRSLEINVHDGKARLLGDPFIEGGDSVALYISYGFSWAGPVGISKIGNNDEKCNLVNKKMGPLSSKWESNLLQKNIVPSKDAIDLLKFYNPNGIDKSFSTVYPEFVPISSEEQQSFDRQYSIDSKPDPRLASKFKKLVDNFGKKIQDLKQSMSMVRGEVGMRDLQRMWTYINSTQVILSNLYELHFALDDIVTRENLHLIPRITLELATDEINTVIELLPKVHDPSNNKLIMRFIEDLQLLAFPYVPKYRQNQSVGTLYNDYQSGPSLTGGQESKIAIMPPPVEDHLRQFHFYIYKNAKPAPKKQYRVYCVPAAKYEYYMRKGKSAKDLSMFMCQEPASVSSQNLPLGLYYIFAVKIGESEVPADPQKYHTGRIVRQSTDGQLPYSFCIDVKD
jgi:hypothetical protein